MSSGELQPWAEVCCGYESHVNPKNDDEVTEYGAAKETKMRN